jgi:hydrogenase nickel incorporation protein HypA/HybF
MHEMSLVQGLIQQLNDLAIENKMTKVIKVTMEIGPLSGVVVDSFTFGFEVLAPQDPLLKDAELIIDVPPVTYSCPSCKNELQTTGDRPDQCEKCQEVFLIPSGGDDLILKQVEME